MGSGMGCLVRWMMVLGVGAFGGVSPLLAEPVLNEMGDLQALVDADGNSFRGQPG